VPSRTVDYVGILNYYPMSVHNIMKLQMSMAWLTLILNQGERVDFFKTYETTLILLPLLPTLLLYTFTCTFPSPHLC